MIIGIPKEVKTHEYRVAATPEGVRELVHAGHRVVVETTAGVGSAITDADFEGSGAQILADADAVFAAADLIVKVKEPQSREFERFKEGQLLFTYLHLAADRGLTEFLVERKVRGVAYETVQFPTVVCRCSRRCPRSPGAWRLRRAPPRSNGRRGDAAC